MLETKVEFMTGCSIHLCMLVNHQGWGVIGTTLCYCSSLCSTLLERSGCVESFGHLPI